MKYSIKVSEVKNGSENLKGLATVVLGDSFKLSNISILKDPRNDQLYVAMPSYKTNQVDEQEKAVYKDIFNPTTAEFRKELYDNVLSAFKELQEHQAGNSYRVEINKKDTTMPEFDVRVTPFEKEDSNIKGLASVKLENCIVVNNISIKESKEGNLYVDMPSYKSKQVDEQGKAVYKDICNPVTAKFQTKLSKAVIKGYEAAKNARDSVLGKLQGNKESINTKNAEAPEKDQHQHDRDNEAR